MIRTIPLKIQNEYITGDKGMIGAAGSHNDVILRMEFSGMWDGLTKMVQFRDALGEATIEVLLTADMLEADDTSVYLVPVPNGAKKYAGEMTLCIKGAAVSAQKETRATLAVYGRFAVAESKWSADAETEADVPATNVERLQGQIENVLATIVDARKAAQNASESAKAAEKSAQDAGQKYMLASAAANNAATFAQRAASSAEKAGSYNNGAQSSANRAATSEKNAATSERNAASSAATANGAKYSAESAATEAASSQRAAKQSENNAKTYERNASSSANNARVSERNASTYASSAAESIKHAPRINTDGKWELWDAAKNAYVATEYTAIGTDGITPTIGANGNWYLGSTDTGKPSRGATGAKGDPGSDAAVTYDNVTAALGYKPVSPNQIVWAIPEQYGAVGDGAADDTDAINACLAANRNVIFSKTYKIKADKNNYNGSSTPDRYTYGVSVPSGRTLLFGGGAKLVCQTSNAAYSAVLCMYGTSDVSIIGATIVGDRATNTLTTGEWGHGIVCRAANNVIIRDCTICNCFGDGIVIGTSTATDEDAIGSDICVENCKIYNNRRQGITVGGGKNITIKDCEIYEINGTAPQAGIDIEPNQATTEVSNVLISNCYFHDNASWDITNYNGAQMGIVIENCRCDGSVNIATGEVAICGGSYRSIRPVGGQLTISDITVDQIFGNPKNTVVRNSKIIGNEADSYTIAFDHDNGYALTLIGCEITNVRNIILKPTGTITFVGCKIVHKTDRLFSSQGHIRAFNTVFDFSDAAVSAQPINCATIELNNCDFFTNGKGTLIGINDETDVKDWINNRFHGSLTTLSYKANRLINNVFNFSHTKIKPTATGARIGNVWTDLEEGACTDDAIKSYGYIKLEDLPKYEGGVS